MSGNIDNIHVLQSAKTENRTLKAAEKETRPELEKACRDFESIFVNYMMQQMRKTVPENSLFGTNQGEKIYTGMLDDEIAKSVSQSRGLGLAKAMYEQMSNIGGHDNKKE